MKSNRIGKKMAYVKTLAKLTGGIAVIDCARQVGPHGSLTYGYQLSPHGGQSGIVKYAAPLPGRRGTSLVPNEE